MQASSGRIGSTPPTRSRRVIIMLGLTLVLQLIDLTLTSHAMATMGMWENNPIVLQIMRMTESLWALGAYKVATIAVGLGILYKLRDRWSAEIGAVIALAISGVVCLTWIGYLHEMQGISAEDLEMLRQAGDAYWVRV